MVFNVTLNNISVIS